MVLGKYDSYRPPEKKSSLDHRDEYDDDHDQVAWDRGRDDRSRDERRDVYRDSDPAVYNSENFSLNRRRSAAISNVCATLKVSLHRVNLILILFSGYLCALAGPSRSSEKHQY